MWTDMHILPQDNNGSIENEELKGFLKDLLELVKKVGKDLMNDRYSIRDSTDFGIGFYTRIQPFIAFCSPADARDSCCFPAHVHMIRVAKITRHPEPWPVRLSVPGLRR